MKTKLPFGTIATAEQAMKFISDLFNNDEHFNFEDDANTVFKEVNGRDSKIFTIKEAKRVNELISDCYAVKNFNPNKYLLELISSHEEAKNHNAWQFVEEHYPNYHHCNEIAYNNDLSVIIENDGVCDESSCAYSVFKDLNFDLSLAKKEFDKSLLDIYEKSIENFLIKNN